MTKKTDQKQPKTDKKSAPETEQRVERDPDELVLEELDRVTGGAITRAPYVPEPYVPKE
jgi:hypothetical protein